MQTAGFYEVQQPANDSVVEKLSSTGFAIVRDITRTEFEDIVDSIAFRRAHRDSGADGVTEIHAILDDESRNGYAGFTRFPMPPHSDGSAQEEPPQLLSMWCAQPATSGGDSTLVDVVQVLGALAAEHPESIAAIRELVVELGKPSPYRGTLLKRTSNSLWSFRFRDDGIADYSALGNHVRHLREAIRNATFRVNLGEGDAYFLNNFRWLHGREGFEGSRSMMRILGDFRVETSERGLDAGFVFNHIVSPLGVAS